MRPHAQKHFFNIFCTLLITGPNWLVARLSSPGSEAADHQGFSQHQQSFSQSCDIPPGRYKAVILVKSTTCRHQNRHMNRVVEVHPAQLLRVPIGYVRMLVRVYRIEYCYLESQFWGITVLPPNCSCTSFIILE